MIYAQAEEERMLWTVQGVIDDGLAKPILIGRRGRIDNVSPKWAYASTPIRILRSSTPRKTFTTRNAGGNTTSYADITGSIPTKPGFGSTPAPR